MAVRQRGEPAVVGAARRLLGDRRLLIATNRGPVTFTVGPHGALRPRRGSGGLVTALSQIGDYLPVTWMAAPMSEGDRRAAADPRLIDRALPSHRVRLRFATVERAAHEAAYNVIANPLLWFLQHQMWELPTRPMIDAGTMRAWENGYVAVNRAFAEALLREAGDDPRPRIMLHDYHLYLAADPIRQQRPEALLSHFTHIPWPPSSLWQTISPTIRTGIVAGLVANDVVGFQTERYAHNFLRSVESFLPGARVDYRNRKVTLPGGRVVRVRHYPISIDVEATRRVASSTRARRRADQLLAASRERIIVRVDRLEPSKNILRGFAAFEALLQRNPRLRGRVTFLAFLVPSRTSLREYGEYGRKVQGAVDRINARFGRAGYRPVQLFYENDYPQALAGLSIADVVLVNPLVDGMNLVAKEAAVVSQRNAVIVLSETAGAHDQMADGVLPVAPADVLGTAEALAAALAMPEAERAERLAALRAGVEREDIAWWLRRQLRDLAAVAEQRERSRR
ncbi:MAG TPA: trehalose-6-phosphate synthase [candidate division Zixibacteria bacterium]|nr:trehalose-6-phosphate synthase [candidate division Zixibacteria bacterium]